jgi:uracil-DNA glycosylase family 4
MSENSNCTLCVLHEKAYSVCLPGWGCPLAEAKLFIFLDSPNMMEDRTHKGGAGKASELLVWMLRRMSLQSGDGVRIDCVLKCSRGKQLTRKAERFEAIEACSKYRLASLASSRGKPAQRSLVAMGSVAVEAFIGKSEIGQYEGTWWEPNEPFVREQGFEKVWCSYSPSYALESPAETGRIYRVIYKAAEACRLKPKFNKKLPAYEYDI